ncbi:MAG: Rrf2 family transcriptional regulator [Gemmatimonadales bacterium]|nr:Rrf2 family transcriptional regulator [Gemmatimonadales bacterium]NIN11805.1 Rrf2 family transcriptional regulator [Gemmatimonadales bacterium]NIN50355.1 Rrf2 family transcriptional regulator [Gemmatimonadales bacterium]NIP07819.1 Rrf2 family transcriptional regulator [Gemmatimonadales bacterium]NIR01897.1 Rrf2 family transcriptional regulator [Gemmatimonadales bacterium]
MVLSGTAEYALKAVLYLAEHAVDQPVRVGEVAQALRIPQNYLSKILHELTRAGVLRSSRGKRGGFQLAVRPQKLSLRTVITRFDDIAERRSCLLGRSQCSDRHACAVHWRWKALAEQLAAFFAETTVADLLEGVTLPA